LQINELAEVHVPQKSNVIVVAFVFL